MATLIKNGTIVTATEQVKSDVLIEGEKIELRGASGAKLFMKGEEPKEFAPFSDLSFLMEQ